MFSLCIGAALIALFWLPSWWVARQDFQQWNTESNLMVIPKGEHFDWVFLGNSHARNFSRHENHLRMEKFLQKNILNLGQGLGICGPNEQNLYLKYVLSKGNTFDKLVYTISAPLLYGDNLNQATNTFFQEPFQFDFFLQAILHPAENKHGRLRHYLFSKLRPLWLSKQPSTNTAKIDALASIDSIVINKGFELAYPLGRLEENFVKNTKFIEESFEMARAQGAEIILLTTPTLFGSWPGHERVARYCDSLTKADNNIRYLDYSNVVKNPQLFYDHHHLNSKGIDSLLTIMNVDLANN